MLTPKIFVVNLKKYNEGETTGEWFNYPFSAEEVLDTIFDEDEFDENGNALYDYEILDWELPFKISPFENIDNINSKLEKIENTGIDFDFFMKTSFSLEDVSELIEFGNAVNSDYVQDFIHESEINGFLENQDWLHIKFVLQYIEYTDDEYFLINGYGHLENIKPDDLKSLFDDLMEELFR